jgi:hypothetical protein
MLAALLGWFAIGLQYWLVMTGDIGPDPVNRTINFFSYFTILTNILAALAMTLPVIAPRTSLGAFFSRPTVRTAIATYIIIVGVTYHLILRHQWNPEGWALVADTALHYVTPILFVLDWLVFVQKRSVPWKNAFAALVFPLIYMAWTFAHGIQSGFYPYPFVDLGALGLEKVLVNAAGMMAAFAFLGLVLIAVGRLVGQRTSAA